MSLDFSCGATEETDGLLDVRIRGRIMKEAPFSLGPNGNLSCGAMGHRGSGTVRSEVSE